MSAPDAPDDWSPAADEAAYVYGIARPPVATGDLDGLHGRPVRPVQHGPLVAFVSGVDPADWTGDAGAEHMQDLAWVGPRAYQHEQVVEALLEAADAVYPARFGTLFSTLDRLRERLDARRDTLLAFFEEVEEAEEWAVKGLLDRDQAAARRTDAPEAADSGTAYLQRQKERQEAAASLDAWLDEAADALLDALGAYAADTRVLPVRGNAGREQEVAFNWAFLVPDPQVEAFQREAYRQHEHYDPEGLALDVTGPWPPYNFRPSLDPEEDT
jgi:hypothetical protein